MKKFDYKLPLFLLLTLFLFACSDDETETIYAPTQGYSFLNGDWSGFANEEQKTLKLDVTLKENYGAVSGSGTVRVTESNDISNIDIEFSGSFYHGIIEGSQISFIMESPADSDYVSYNGGLDKNDSTKFIGNAIYYLSSQHRSIRFDMILNKQ
jgi:hypothetical protein